MVNKGGIVDEVVSPLLAQLASIKHHVLKSATDCGTTDKFKNIESDVKGIKDLIHGVRKWERKLIGKLGIVGRHVDDMLASIGKGDELKLEQVGECSTLMEKLELSTMFPPINVPSNEIPSSLSQPSTTGDVIALDEVHEPKLKELLDRSPAMLSHTRETIDTLDLREKRSLFCLLAFPEDSVVKKRLLIYCWIGVGFIRSAGDKTAEENGERCFEDLVYKCLVQPIYRKHSTVAYACRMPPVIRKMVISAVTRDQFFHCSEENLAQNLEGTEQDGSLQIVRNLSIEEEILMMFNTNKQYLKFDKDYFIKNRMAVMHIGRWQSSEEHHIEVMDTEFLEVLASSNTLRYLSLQGISRITKLPYSIGKLTSIVILDLQACHNLEELPVSISLLRELTHLDVSKCYLLDHLPKGISSLSRLQVLKGFVIANSRSKDPCRLSDLAKLEKLRKITISIGRESFVSQVEFKNLSAFGALRSMTITGGVVKSEEVTFSPPKDLEKLDIRCLPTEDVPKWLTAENMPNLKKLYIRGGKLAHLPKGPSFSKMEVLRLRFLNFLTFQQEGLKDVFPNLTYLEIWKCKEVDAGAENWMNEINSRHRYRGSLI